MVAAMSSMSTKGVEMVPAVVGGVPSQALTEGRPPPVISASPIPLAQVAFSSLQTTISIHSIVASSLTAVRRPVDLAQMLPLWCCRSTPHGYHPSTTRRQKQICGRQRHISKGRKTIFYSAIQKGKRPRARLWILHTVLPWQPKPSCSQTFRTAVQNLRSWANCQDLGSDRQLNIVDIVRPRGGARAGPADVERQFRYSSRVVEPG
jgi:hypothetical protein